MLGGAVDPLSPKANPYCEQRVLLAVRTRSFFQSIKQIPVREPTLNNSLIEAQSRMRYSVTQ
jgi:hypothetical protein